MTRTSLLVHPPLRRERRRDVGGGGGGFTMSLSLCLLLFIGSRNVDANMLPNPVWTCDLVPNSRTKECCHVLVGTPEDYAHHEDVRGYTIEKMGDYWMYVRRDESTGKLRPLDYICGMDNPPADLAKHARPTWKEIKSTCHTTCEISSRNHFLSPVNNGESDEDEDYENENQNEDAHHDD
eukprot:scaffold49330_cov54-Attheya_sp.AAC.1